MQEVVGTELNDRSWHKADTSFANTMVFLVPKCFPCSPGRLGSFPRFRTST